MPPHQPLKECIDEFKKLNEGQSQISAQLFDIKDNHLKHINEKLDKQNTDIIDLKVAGAHREGKLSLLVWAIPLAFAIIGAIIVLIDKLWS
jgi:septal ring factor EnvC (AmiA/AmiB activator)